MRFFLLWATTSAWLVLLSGCSAIPDVVHQPQFHNPFPQLSRVAVLPFYNQSADPTVDSDRMALAYYNELQAIRGFEVVPIGAAKQALLATGIDPQTSDDFRKLAKMMGDLLGVDAIVVGSITDYSPYYPPRMGLSVRWYAANPNFHPIPPGYGLPWGTPQEEFIPEDLLFDAEFALAQEQLKTQTPVSNNEDPNSADPNHGRPSAEELPDQVSPANALRSSLPKTEEPSEGVATPPPSVLAGPPRQGQGLDMPSLPADWPDPRGFVPPPPSVTPPPAMPQYEPVITLTRFYDGHDGEFTERLANYYYFRDDARSGEWQGYLQRSDDFVRFCCHLHITEMLAARGGAGKTRVVWRWPIRRYER